ncbi:hypothetical protein HO133_007556 [Letharia lupina]|uniref:Rhodopsin domain-containing protein n=1 Tax=Letharia lupina TaxID=560253 RepID=A0A8H6KYZ3_9LECA|nr:uncharacterized protein HO133_007556 [Letharia lupina]KAF6229440.1 hypothetical protein HO133_007556 [Letharia lupina]
MATPSPPVQDSNLRGMTVSSISLVTFAIGANLVFLRMYVRMKRRITGWDDYTICVALVILPSDSHNMKLSIAHWTQTLSLLGTVANVYQVANGAGRHIDTLTPVQLSEFIKWTFVQGIEFVIGTCFVKISVCISILRFITKTRHLVRYFIYVIMGFLIISTLGLVIALLAQCRPLRALYDLDLKGKCYSENVSTSIAYVQAAINIFTDFTSLKIGLSVVMGLGVVTASFSILRIAFLHTNSSADVTHADAVNMVFAVLEQNLGIIAASIATVRPLFANLGPIVQVSSETVRGPYASDRPFLGYSNVPGAGGMPKSIALSPMRITQATNVDLLRKCEGP